MDWKILTTIILSISLAGCAADIEPIEPTVADDTGATAEGVTSVVTANNQFALDLYSKLKGEGGNVFFSPYSISTALAMTYEGARGQTAEEMKEVFYFPDSDFMRPSFAKIYNLINKEDKKYKLHTANALWAQQDYAFLPEYLGLVGQYYGGKTTNLDFVTKTEESRKIINDWVEEKTNNKIKDLIPPGAINAMTRLVLTNAIYFKGTWVKQFDKKNTREWDFRISPDKIVKAQMMSLQDEEFNYADTEKLQILEMPYDGEELSMLILLPKEDDIESLEESLNAEKLNELRNMLTKQEVDVYIPKFTFETKYFMVPTLKEMGMPTAFSANADFSGMDGTRNLFISNVIHQAFVEVNEEGTEAAAATAVIVALTAMPTNMFIADHPFIFIIQERETGNILFLGKVVNPAAE